jgi:molybdenum cofactor biosynthesis protein B
LTPNREGSTGAHEHHKSTAPSHVGCFVLTVSDTRTSETDKSGRLVRELLGKAGHHVVGSQIIPDDLERIQAAVQLAVESRDTEVVLITGGTGIARRDRTVEAVRPMFHQELNGYGELFRMLSFNEIGPSAMLSRAVAGVAGGKAVFVMPGSSGGVTLAMTRLILPELGHIAGELRKRGSG